MDYSFVVVLFVLVAPTLITVSVIKNEMGFLLGFGTGVVVGVWSGVLDRWWITLVIIALIVVLFTSYQGGGSD